MDGRLVYVGPTPKLTVSNPLGLPTTSGGEPALFMAAPSGAGLTAEEGERLGSTTSLMAPTWAPVEETGQPGLLALARAGQGSKPLVVRAIDTVSGAVRNLDMMLPAGVGGAGAVSARWDLGHGQLLVVASHDNTNSGQLDFWLVQVAGQAGVSR